MLSVPRSVSRRTVGFFAIGALMAAGLTVSTADAATPTEGTVSSTSKTVTWSGGPFVVPNATGNALDQPDCTAPSSCDDFTLHVDTPAGYGTANQLTVKVSWANTAADFDTYLLDSQGNIVASAASSADPETMIVPPTSGDYTVRVVPFAPLGQSFDATATLAAKPANPPPGTDTPPGFANYAAPSSFADANNAGEPSIGTSWKSGSTFYQAYLSTYKVKFNDAVSPATASWTDVSATATNGCLVGGTESLDPILFTDHMTGRTFESQLSGANSLTCYTDDDGTTWSPTTGGGIPSGVDHQTIGGGSYSPDGVGALPTSSYPNAVYYCSQDIATAFCGASHDGGTTFGPGVPTYSLLDCGGLHGHIKVAPDGTAYLPNKGCGANQAVVVSKDNGASWTVEKVPSSTPGDSDPAVGVGSNGTVYFGYVGADGKPGVATSTDQGKTWKYGQSVGTKYAVQNAVFPTMVAGDDNRASFAYLGTPTAGNYQDTANFKGVWHLYVDTTYDGGKTWVTSDATPTNPVQVGSICTGGTTCGDDRNLLDFIDMTIDQHGRVEVGYADGCTGTCATGGVNNHDAYATIARQTTGKPLFSKYDPKTANLTLRALKVAKRNGRFVATVVVKNTGSTALAGVRTQVLDNRKQVTLTAATSLAAGASKTLTVTWTPSSTRSHTVTAVADPKNSLAETNESDNKRSVTVTR